MVIAGCLLILVANGLIFRDGATGPNRLPVLQVFALITLVWMYAGAYGMCIRKGWGRGLVLTVTYLGTVGAFLSAVIPLATDEGPLVGHEMPFFIAMAIYLYVSLVLTHSKHVHRLTSRVWE